jgi:hypothetical protein
LKERRDEKAELEDEEWLFYLAFFADFAGKLSDMKYSFNQQKQIQANDDWHYKQYF